MTAEKPDHAEAESLRRLSEIIIEALKEISSARRPLASSTLCEVLGRHKDVQSLVSGGDHNGTPELTEEERAYRRNVERIQKENRGLKAKEMRLMRQLGELEDERSEHERFFRRSLLTMTSMAMNPSSAPVDGLLAQFKELLVRNGDMAAIQNTYQLLKDALQVRGLNDGGSESERSEESSSLLGRLLPNRKKPKVLSGSDSSLSQELRRLYEEILVVLPLDPSAHPLNKMKTLQASLAGSSSGEQLSTLRREIVSLINASVTSVLEEKKQITRFLSEMGQNLTQIENLLISSMGTNTQTARAHLDFNRIIDGHMNDIRDSLEATDSLPELKKLVLNKMSTIKMALEARRAADETQLAEVTDGMGGLQEKLHQVQVEIRQVREQAQKLEKEVDQDALTRAYNRRAYEKRVVEEFQRYLRYQQGFSIILFDVDEFKEVNDQYGHSAGDKCLKEIVGRIKKILRVSDFLARYGGDEFVIILPGIRREVLAAVAEKLRVCIEDLRFLFQGQPIKLSISIGAAEIGPEDADPESVFNRADRALYEAKRNGRNCVMIA